MKEKENMYQLFPQTQARKSLVPGTWYLVPGTWYLVPGTWYLVPGTFSPSPWLMAHGTNGNNESLPLSCWWYGIVYTTLHYCWCL